MGGGLGPMRGISDDKVGLQHDAFRREQLRGFDIIDQDLRRLDADLPLRRTDGGQGNGIELGVIDVVVADDVVADPALEVPSIVAS